MAFSRRSATIVTSPHRSRSGRWRGRKGCLDYRRGDRRALPHRGDDSSLPTPGPRFVADPLSSGRQRIVAWRVWIDRRCRRSVRRFTVSSRSTSSAPEDDVGIGRQAARGPRFVSSLHTFPVAAMPSAPYVPSGRESHRARPARPARQLRRASPTSRWPPARSPPPPLRA